MAIGLRASKTGAILLAAALVCGAAIGCGKRYDLAPVSGAVMLDGRPLSQGTVLFVPDQGVAASGEIQPDGRFRLATPGHGEGAVIGHHRVCILPANPLDRVANLPSGPIDGPNTGDPNTGGPSDVAPPRADVYIPPRYQVAETSGLIADVTATENTLNFALVTEP